MRNVWLLTIFEMVTISSKYYYFLIKFNLKINLIQRCYTIILTESIRLHDNVVFSEKEGGDFTELPYRR